ncbi:Glutathione-regulated potassium-efflux system ancillary protein KefF [Devosia sp. LC5]|uniref:NAD(P)H-dependent oxidoreductase n=1 Tax=Devosia sp. LC5 TaxID=1502724 RepID=UPI0004E32D42|nr:NAD(P)H-dependent oxidoreductase [Devosia sp. LC5]KFC71093.1 Glutathione-regulated potassium-efflux system ancillary protein KefF [Devosia sp. LC5]
MHALIVLAHPDPKSLTHAVAAQIADGVQGNGRNSFEIADLAAEGFDPRFTKNDIAVHLREAEPASGIVAEQARIGRADTLVLVYPVYWWSMPGLLKGWIDRVFTNGWAYSEGADGRLVKKLDHLPVHLVALGGADLRTYARHGYFGAMKTQIDHGIFGYCGAPVVTSELLVPPASDSHFETARRIGGGLFAAALSADAA